MLVSAPHHTGNPLIDSRHVGELSPDYLSRADLAREMPKQVIGMTKRGVKTNKHQKHYDKRIHRLVQLLLPAQHAVC